MCDFEKLKAKFAPEELEWRVQQSGTTKAGKPWALVLTYVTNRAIMDRLDEVVGPANWKNEFTVIDGAFLCGISIKHDDEWITKWDGADETNIEKTKGGLSSSMKRSAVQWGIGRYLYKLEASFAMFSDNGTQKSKIGNAYHKWNPPALPKWALPEGTKPAEKAPEKVEVQKPADKPTESKDMKQKGEPGTDKNGSLWDRFKNLRSGNGFIKFWKSNMEELISADNDTKQKFLDKWAIYTEKGEIALPINLQIEEEKKPLPKDRQFDNSGDPVMKDVEETLGEDCDNPIPIKDRFEQRCKIMIQVMVKNSEIPEGTEYHEAEMDRVLNVIRNKFYATKFENLDAFKEFIDGHKDKAGEEDSNELYRRMLIRYAEPS